MATRLSERVSLMLSYAWGVRKVLVERLVRPFSLPSFFLLRFFLLRFFLLRFFLLRFFLARCVHGREAVLRDIHAP
jgi:hypothetical protein